MSKLISLTANPKAVKSNKSTRDRVTAMMMIKPDIKVCPMSRLAGCDKVCLDLGGRGVMRPVIAARTRKTEWWLSDPDSFLEALRNEIHRLAKRHHLALRLNGLSDIPWENYGIPQEFPTVQFYDYTKLPGRKVPDNYHLTVSFSGANQKYADKVLRSKHNWAVVFRDAVPTEWHGRKVYEGDSHDRRWEDKPDAVIALKAKGKAKHDTSGFVVDYVDCIATG